MKKIRTAIIGYGRSGQFLHGAGIRANAAFEVVAISTVSPSSKERAEADFACPVYADYQQMFDEEDLDLVVIVTRNDMHCAMACDALKAGVNVLVTKPIGLNEAEVRKIIEAGNVHGKRIFPYLPSRWGSDLIRLQEIIESGEIGKVFCVRRATYGFATRDDWQTQRKFGGGIVLNWAPHLIDTPMLLAGGQPTSVFGLTDQVLNPGDAEDIYYSIIKMDNGVTVHSEWSFAPKGLPNWFVQGTSGCIIVHNQEIEIHSGVPIKPADPTKHKEMEGSGVTVRKETVGEHLYGDPVAIYAELAADLTGVNAEGYRVTSDHALQLTRVLDAVRDSQSQQTIIKL